MKQLKVGVVSYPIEEGLSWKKFAEKFDRYVQRAVSKGTDLLIFPELLTLDMALATGPKLYAEQLRDLASSKVPSDFFALVKTLSQKHKLHILGGTCPLLTKSGIKNTAVLCSPEGHTWFQEKIFLTPFEREWGWQGGDQIQILDLPWGRTVILVCYDCEFPMISETISQRDVEIILIPSMTGAMTGKNRVSWSAHARAIEHHAYVIVAGTVQASEEPNMGQAQIITPQDDGYPVGSKRSPLNKPGILFSTLDLDLLKKGRARRTTFPVFDQNVRQKKDLTLSNS